MPSKQCILFATLQEAEVTLSTLNAEKITQELYKSANGHILITGMGMQHTEKMLLNYIHLFDDFLNMGIAGALKTDIVQDTLLQIRAVSSQESTIELQEAGLHLFTHHEPLHDPNERDRLAEVHDLVDMEGYTIAKLCKAHKKSCRLYKIVSDFCTKTTSEEIRQALPKLSKQLAAHVSALTT